MSRIGREYAVSDQRKLFVASPPCRYEQTLSWANVRWDRDEAGEHLPDTAAIACGDKRAFPCRLQPARPQQRRLFRASGMDIAHASPTHHSPRFVTSGAAATHPLGRRYPSQMP